MYSYPVVACQERKQDVFEGIAACFPDVPDVINNIIVDYATSAEFKDAYDTLKTLADYQEMMDYVDDAPFYWYDSKWEQRILTGIKKRAPKYQYGANRGWYDRPWIMYKWLNKWRKSLLKDIETLNAWNYNNAPPCECLVCTDIDQIEFSL